MKEQGWSRKLTAIGTVAMAAVLVLGFLGLSKWPVFQESGEQNNTSSLPSSAPAASENSSSFVRNGRNYNALAHVDLSFRYDGITLEASPSLHGSDYQGLIATISVIVKNQSNEKLMVAWKDAMRNTSLTLSDGTTLIGDATSRYDAIPNCDWGGAVNGCDRAQTLPIQAGEEVAATLTVRRDVPLAAIGRISAVDRATRFVAALVVHHTANAMVDLRPVSIGPFSLKNLIR